MPGKVKVKILAGRNLPVMDRSSDTTDAYVEIKLGNTTYKTDVYRKSLNPQWNSDWYKYEVDDSELQDEPLQIRLMDHDTYSANDAIGKVYLDLNPLLLPSPPPMKNISAAEGVSATASVAGGATMAGWIPVFDTMHGIRGEVNIIVKVELFSDFNKFRQSSCGVQFFCSPVIPHGYHAQVVHGFVEELVVNDDPEYQWIDKIRTPRASNEARQTLFFKLSGEVQRKIGLKALDLGGNAVIGYQQCFDLEGESGIVVRGIGTAVTLTRLQDILPSTATFETAAADDMILSSPNAINSGLVADTNTNLILSVSPPGPPVSSFSELNTTSVKKDDYSGKKSLYSRFATKYIPRGKTRAKEIKFPVQVIPSYLSAGSKLDTSDIPQANRKHQYSRHLSYIYEKANYQNIPQLLGKNRKSTQSLAFGFSNDAQTDHIITNKTKDQEHTTSHSTFFRGLKEIALVPHTKLKGKISALRSKLQSDIINNRRLTQRNLDTFAATTQSGVVGMKEKGSSRQNTQLFATGDIFLRLDSVVEVTESSGSSPTTLQMRNRNNSECLCDTNAEENNISSKCYDADQSVLHSGSYFSLPGPDDGPELKYVDGHFIAYVSDGSSSSGSSTSEDDISEHSFNVTDNEKLNSDFSSPFLKRKQINTTAKLNAESEANIKTDEHVHINEIKDKILVEKNNLDQNVTNIENSIYSGKKFDINVADFKGKDSCHIKGQHSRSGVPLLAITHTSTENLNSDVEWRVTPVDKKTLSMKRNSYSYGEKHFQKLRLDKRVNSYPTLILPKKLSGIFQNCSEKNTGNKISPLVSQSFQEIVKTSPRIACPPITVTESHANEQQFLNVDVENGTAFVRSNSKIALSSPSATSANCPGTMLQNVFISPIHKTRSANYVYPITRMHDSNFEISPKDIVKHGPCLLPISRNILGEDSIPLEMAPSPARIPLGPASIHRRSSDSDLSITPKGNSLTGSDRSSNVGCHFRPVRPAVNQDNLEMLEYPFLTMRKYSSGFIQHLGGTVSSRSVKLLERITNLEEPESRDSWWTELRMEVRSHARAMGCNVVLGYSEQTSICDDVCVLSASGTAAIINMEVGESSAQYPLSRPHLQAKELMTTSLDRTDFEKDKSANPKIDSSVPLPQPKIHNLTDSSEPEVPVGCTVCHIPYSESSVPFRISMQKCAVCRRGKVPDVLFITIEPPDGLPVVGRGCFLQAYVCRPKRVLRGELNAKEISDGLPFLEYELHRLLLNKLKLTGMNSIFGLKVQVAIGEKMMIGLASGTAVFIAALPVPPIPKISCGNPWTDGKRLAEIQKNIVETVKKNRELYHLKNIVEPDAQSNGKVTASDTDDSEDELPELDLSAGNKDTWIFEIDDSEDVDKIALLIDPRPPEGFHTVNIENVPGLDDLEAVHNLQMFTQVWRAKISSNHAHPGAFSHHINRLLQSVYFKLRRMVPCALCNLQFRVELPELDEVQLSVLGMAVGLSELGRNVKTRKKILPPINKEDFKKFDEADMIFNLEEDQEIRTSSPLPHPMQSARAQSPHYISFIPKWANMHQAIGEADEECREKMVPVRDRYGVDITPLSYVPGGRIERYLGNLNFFFIRESTSIREGGGLSGFVHSFVTEVLAIVRAHVTALGGNAMVAYFMSECVLYHNPHKNQGQCLINVGGDVVAVSYFSEE